MAESFTNDPRRRFDPDSRRPLFLVKAPHVVDGQINGGNLIRGQLTCRRFDLVAANE